MFRVSFDKACTIVCFVIAAYCVFNHYGIAAASWMIAMFISYQNEKLGEK